MTYNHSLFNEVSVMNVTVIEECINGFIHEIKYLHHLNSIISRLNKILYGRKSFSFRLSSISACRRVGIEKLKACLQVVKSSLPPMLPSHPFPNWNELGSARIWLIFVLVDRESFKLHALTVSYQNLLSLICIIIV